MLVDYWTCHHWNWSCFHKLSGTSKCICSRLRQYFPPAYINYILALQHTSNYALLYSQTYVGEISTQRYRGLLGAGNQLSIVIGIFIIYAIGGALDWRWLALTSAAVPTLYCILCLFIPETPRHLYMKNKRRESQSVLQYIRQTADVDAEIDEMHDSITMYSTEATWKDIIFTSAIRKPLLLSAASMFLQQFSGINCVMFYSKNIFKDAGFETDAKQQMGLLLVAGIQIIFTFISCLLIDKTGRKVLLIISTTVMCLSMITFGVYFQLTDGNDSHNLTWLALASLMVYMAAFSIGLGPIPWILMVELIPLRAKGKCGGIVTTINLLSAFIITKEFKDLTVHITNQGTYWFFAGISFLALLFTIFLIPETKDRSLEDIERSFHSQYESISSYKADDENPHPSA
ncbi:facilitated trehalose transporter Tret1-like isoform X2 [Clavelina lepadiformis]|uniref:facilitated trehalose transporter Tret1-like isoform X2 n=1 Tax=Clavelina lepadiformis TaxID=159417 RepID=UPI0040433A52